MKNIKPFMQSSFDSLCGVVSILNAYQLVSGASSYESEILYREIIEFLAKKKILKDVILDGINHRLMKDIFYSVAQNRFKEFLTDTKWAGWKVKDFWEYSTSWLSEDRRAIILSIGGKYNHYSVLNKITPRTFHLTDSSGLLRIYKHQISFPDYLGEDKYKIYPTQCWFLR